MKKTIAIILTAIMTVTAFPASVYADAASTQKAVADLSATLNNTVFDVANSKYGALPQNISVSSQCVVHNGKMYFLSFNSIMRANLDGSNITKIYEEFSDFGMFNLQIMGNRIYWTQRSWSGADTAYIKCVNMDGSGVKKFSETGEDMFIAYDGKLYVRKSSDLSQIVSYNADGSGRKVLFASTNTMNLDLISGWERKRLEWSGAYCPFGIKDGRIYFEASGKKYSMKTDGTDMKEETYVDYSNTGRGSGNSALLKVGNNTIEYKTTFYTNSIDGAETDIMINGQYHSTIKSPLGGTGGVLNLLSPDYIYISPDNALFSINPNIKEDILLYTRQPGADGSNYPVYKATKTTMKIQPQGVVKEGWYELRCMYNYIHIDGNGNAELNNIAPHQKFKFTRITGTTYTIQTESGKYLSVDLNANGKVDKGARVKATDTPMEWYILHEKGTDIFSMRVNSNENEMLNCCEWKNENGTPIITWPTPNKDAPENGEFRFIPA